MKDDLILIAGFGSVGRRHFQNLRRLGYSNFIFYRSYQSTLVDSEISEWTTVTDLEEALIQRPKIAIISNPSSLHLPVAMSAAQADCHLFIEKPLAHSMTGCTELAALVKQKELITMIGCQFRFHPLLNTLREQLQRGRIGNVIGARAEWGEYLPQWHPWEDYWQSYSARSDLGGGVILTLIHPLDYLYWFFGPITQIHSATRSIDLLQTEVNDNLAEITLEFASGVIGQVHLDYIQRPPVHLLTIWGDQGRATLDFLKGTLCWDAVDGSSTLEQVPDEFERNTLFIDEMKHFLDCVDNNMRTRIPLEDGIVGLKIALYARDNAQGKKNDDAIN